MEITVSRLTFKTQFIWESSKNCYIVAQLFRACGQEIMWQSVCIPGQHMYYLPHIFHWRSNEMRCWQHRAVFKPLPRSLTANQLSISVCFTSIIFFASFPFPLSRPSIKPSLASAKSFVLDSQLFLFPPNSILSDPPYTLLCGYSCCCCYITSVTSDSVRPHRWQPTRLSRPWDSPGKNTGVGCHFLLQYLGSMLIQFCSLYCLLLWHAPTLV